MLVVIMSSSVLTGCTRIFLLLVLLAVKTKSQVDDAATFCETPGPIMNGRMQYFPPAPRRSTRPGQRRRPQRPSLDYDLEEYPIGSVLEYSCDEGYRLQGSSSLTCQPTGSWSSEQPGCAPDCGRSFMQTAEKVVNGSRTISGDWPWVVSLSVEEEGGGSRFICGAALLNRHTVITAAHCLQDNRSLILRFGKHQFETNKDDTEVLVRRSTRFQIHPNYSNRTLDSDIALVTFQPRIRYSVRVQPICLPTRESTRQNSVPGRIGYVGGWGETELQVPPDMMLMVSLPVVSDEVCEDAYRPQNLRITRNMFCAGYEDARQSVCGGDSGSPFVFYNKRAGRFTLEGLVSFGLRGQCGVAGKYAIFTKVSRFVQWLKKNSK